MLSQKLQDDLMTAYQKVYEEKKGHAAGDSDTEKQASQLASDVRYKAKGKVPLGASDEEKKKIFLKILAASPAPGVVKAMAKQKLLGEEVVKEMRFDDGKEGKEKRKEALRKKRGMTKDQMDKHPQFKDDDMKEGKMPEGLKKYLEKKQGKKEGKEEVKEGSSYGITRGSGEPSGPMAAFGKKKKEEKKAPRMQKGAMAYDGPNKPASEAKDRLLARAAKKRAEMQMNSYKPEGELVDEMAAPAEKKKPDRKLNNNLMKKIRELNPGAGSQYEQVVHEKKMDPVGKEDKDIDNDGDHDSTDKYLLKRRKAIGKAIAKKRGKVKEGFSAWRIDLDFNEQVKK